jgi:hypothetical protein
VRQHDLSGNRQVWTCDSCGRREVNRPAGLAFKWERLTEKEKDELWLDCKVDGQCLNVEASMKLIDDVESLLIQKNTSK